MSSSSVDQGGDAYSCDDCGWRTVIDGTHSRTDCTQEAIQHHVETAHTVVDRSADHQPDYSRFWLADCDRRPDPCPVRLHALMSDVSGSPDSDNESRFTGGPATA